MTIFLMGKEFLDYVEGEMKDPRAFRKKNATITKIKTLSDWS